MKQRLAIVAIGLVVLAGTGWLYQRQATAMAASRWTAGHQGEIAWLKSKGITFTPLTASASLSSQQAVKVALAPVLAAGNDPNTIKMEDTAYGELKDRAAHDVKGWVIRAAWLPKTVPGQPRDYGHDAIFVVDDTSGQMVYMDVHCLLH